MGLVHKYSRQYVQNILRPAAAEAGIFRLEYIWDTVSYAAHDGTTTTYFYLLDVNISFYYIPQIS